MSFAMAPEKSFIHLVKTIYHNYGILCRPNRPVWSCSVNMAQYEQLPNLKFTFNSNKKGEK
jgi:hypothetical protein